VRTGAPPTQRRVAEYADLVDAWHVTPRLGELLAPELAPVLAAAPGAGGDQGPGPGGHRGVR